MFRPRISTICFSLVLTVLWLAPSAVHAQDLSKAETGPVVEYYGPVFPGQGRAFEYDREAPLRAVFDVGPSPADPAAMNRRIESLARLLNLQARDGVDAALLEVAAVVHGQATFDLLTDEAHQRRFGVANPNRGLIEALANAGAAFYLCGQSASAHGVAVEELLPQVVVAPSAMTAQAVLQRRGYAVMP